MRADTLQFADPQWREELGRWMGRGVFGTSWLLSKMSQLAVTYLDMGERTGRTDQQLLTSAPVIGVLGMEENDRLSEIKCGQAFERMWFYATHLGLALHPMNQVLQVPELKGRFMDLMPDVFEAAA